ncbi:MAG: branched-chain amino acid ABC transporter permease [Desulfobacterales bacterium]|nr:branched-chain amino acid ABC transporter permease [Desulfobacterales bacterium]MBS3755268.1 branched-chain amino acid ABC transporter permease [Desulfobacterales bacterium]
MKNTGTSAIHPAVVKTALFLTAAVIIFLLPQVFRSRFAQSILNQMGIAVIFALSYNMLLGQGGMLSFGHAVFYGLGGFMAVHGLNMVNNGVVPIPTELIPLVGGAFSCIFGLLFGLISTRRAAIPFALITLGIGELIASSALILPSFFGGEEGVSADRWTGVTLSGLDFGRGSEVYLLIAGWMFVSVIIMYLLTRTPLGRMANAVRDNPERALFIGYSPHMVRTIQFTLSAFFAGIAGGLFAINYEILTAHTVGMIPSAEVLMMTYIGGVGHFFGPILGAVLITFLQLFLANITHAWLLYFGLLFIGMVLWAPSGISGLIMLHEPAWKAGLFKKLLPSYAKAFVPGFVLFLGIMVFVEINYHLSLSTDPQSPMSLFGLGFKAQSPLPWIASIVLMILGVLFFRKAMTGVREAWDEITRLMRKGKADG